jgi:hypothetical protein
VLALVTVAVGLVAYSPLSNARAMVMWTPGSLNQELEAGQSTSTAVTFTASATMRNVAVTVSPEIAPYVTISPESIASVQRGRTYSIELHFIAPPDSSGSITEAMISLKQGRQKLSPQLPITLYLTDEDGSIFVDDPNSGIYPVNKINLRLLKETTYEDAQQLADMVDGEIIDVIPALNMYLIRVPTYTTDDLQSTMSLLENDPRVMHATTEQLPGISSIPTDFNTLSILDLAADYTRGYDAKIPQPWGTILSVVTPSSFSHVSFAIINTGIDGAHPDFVGVIRFSVNTEV